MTNTARDVDASAVSPHQPQLRPPGLAISIMTQMSRRICYNPATRRRGSIFNDPLRRPADDNGRLSFLLVSSTYQ